MLYTITGKYAPFNIKTHSRRALQFTVSSTAGMEAVTTAVTPWITATVCF